MKLVSAEFRCVSLAFWWIKFLIVSDVKCLFLTVSVVNMGWMCLTVVADNNHFQKDNKQNKLIVWTIFKNTLDKEKCQGE